MTDELTATLPIVANGFPYTIQLTKAARTGWIATVHASDGQLVWKTETPLPRRLARNRCAAEARIHARNRIGADVRRHVARKADR